MFLISPFKTFFQIFSDILKLPSPGKTLILLFLGIALGWWVYVPIHELMHVAGCLIGGGEVTRLEIAPLYGGDLLSQVFSFVSSGSDYAGRLTGFDIKGSDWTYVLTVYFPFILSLGGFWFMGMARQKRSAFLFGLSFPVALAPIISLTGDFLELGSLVLFQIWPGPGSIHRSLISDDLFRLLHELGSGTMTLTINPSSVLFISLSLLLGTAMAWGTILLADFSGRPSNKKKPANPAT